jgi:predicted DNA-binding transcriptional regulator YafY
MRNSRLLAILILLQLRGRLSASDLAAEFEVSVRTIHRDIDQLSSAGVPVYAERGRDGGFQLMDGYQTKLTGLSGEEAQFVMLGGLGAVAADLGVAPELASAQMKLAASLPPAQGARAQFVEERFLFDPNDWYRARERPEYLALAAHALWQEKRLKIDYDSWEKRAIRILDPLGLVLKSGTWYLVAASRGGLRTYRVSSILSATVQDAPCQRPKGFRLDDYWTKQVRDFEASLLTDTARVRLTAQGVRRLCELSAAAANALSNVPAGPDGHVEADIPVEGINPAAALFLRLGDEVEILSPPPLRQRLYEIGARLVGRYQGQNVPSPKPL